MSFLHIDMVQVVPIFSYVNQELTIWSDIVSIMGADVLATQGAKASATLIFTVLVLSEQN